MKHWPRWSVLTTATPGSDAALQAGLSQATDEARDAASTIHERIDVSERQAERVDARAVVLIAAGVVLTGIPGELADWHPLGIASVAGQRRPGWADPAVAVVGAMTIWRIWTAISDFRELRRPEATVRPA